MEFLSPPPFFFYLVKLATGTLFISFLILLPGNAFCQCFWNTKMPLQPLYNVAFHLEHIPPFLHVAGLSGLVLCMRWSSHLSDLEREVSHRWTLSCSPALARGRLSAFLTGQQPILFLGLPVGEAVTRLVSILMGAAGVSVGTWRGLTGNSASGSSSSANA